MRGHQFCGQIGHCDLTADLIDMVETTRHDPLNLWVVGRHDRGSWVGVNGQPPVQTQSGPGTGDHARIEQAALRDLDRDITGGSPDTGAHIHTRGQQQVAAFHRQRDIPTVGVNVRIQAHGAVAAARVQGHRAGGGMNARTRGRAADQNTAVDGRDHDTAGGVLGHVVDDQIIGFLQTNFATAVVGDRQTSHLNFNRVKQSADATHRLNDQTRVAGNDVGGTFSRINQGA